MCSTDRRAAMWRADYCSSKLCNIRLRFKSWPIIRNFCRLPCFMYLVKNKSAYCSHNVLRSAQVMLLVMCSSDS